jgi:hypothetical protein
MPGGSTSQTPAVCYLNFGPKSKLDNWVVMIFLRIFFYGHNNEIHISRSLALLFRGLPYDITQCEHVKSSTQNIQCQSIDVTTTQAHKENKSLK